MGRLDGRVCLVTGSTGIAAAAAERFAAEGASVFVTSRNPDHCAALASRIKAAGGTVAWRAADLEEEHSAIAAVGECCSTFGRIDGLFAVAGGSGRRYGDGPADAVTIEGWERTLALNGRPAFLVARETLRRMLDQEGSAVGAGGSILLMTSILALSPSPDLFATHAYAAAKGAIISFATAAAAYYAPHGIRVNAIAPGLVESPMSERAKSDPPTLDYITRKQPLAGGLIPPEGIAAAATFLLSDDARYITGQVLRVDGGWSVREAEARS
jgi:NAD(P)-dependent dehydrogenase (short-subunit alcohol dehydrogenase family)